MNLRQAFDLLNIRIKHDDLEEIKSTKDLERMSYFGFGQWVRNTLHLWEDNGTQDIVADILKIPNHPKYTDGFILPGQPPRRADVDETLLHPDNCSHVMILIYKDYLNGMVKI